MSLLWLVTLLGVVVIAGYSVRIAIFVHRCPRLLPDNAAPQAAPLISLVVPARNEAANIERCIRSLLAQTYPNIEIVVVDDESTDATLAILALLAAQDQRLRVVHGKPLPRGWLGKPHALAQGVQHTKGTWLLFVDADVVLQPGVLSSAYLTAVRQGVVLLSLWVRQELITGWERIVQPVIISMGLPLDPFQRVNNPHYVNASAANGQFMLVERKAYRRIGGHSVVRNEVVEDQQLARRFKRAGERILMLDGTRMASARMYTSLLDIWQGWSKNNFLMFGQNYLIVFLALAAVVVITLSPSAVLVYALLNHMYALALANALLIALVLAARRLAHSYFSSPVSDYLSHPIGGLVLIGIILNSAYQHTWGRGVLWKGRRPGDADTPA